MKNIARWVLAFATVTSMSGSALAVRSDCVYGVTMKSGLRKVPVGNVVCQLAEQAGTVWNDECGYVCKWGVAAAPGAAGAVNLYVAQTTTVGSNDCDWNSYYFADGSVSLMHDPFVSFGWNSRLQKARLCNFVGMEDDMSGTIKILATFNTPLSMPNPVTLVPDHCY